MVLLKLSVHSCLMNIEHLKYMTMMIIVIMLMITCSCFSAKCDAQVLNFLKCSTEVSVCTVYSEITLFCEMKCYS